MSDAYRYIDIDTIDPSNAEARCRRAYERLIGDVSRICGRMEELGYVKDAEYGWALAGEFALRTASWSERHPLEDVVAIPLFCHLVRDTDRDFALIYEKRLPCPDSDQVWSYHGVLAATGAAECDECGEELDPNEAPPPWCAGSVARWTR